LATRRSSDVDWCGSSDEIQSMIDDAAGQVVAAMGDDLVSLCAPAGGGAGG